jgi:hypothetical protein
MAYDVGFVRISECEPLLHANAQILAQVQLRYWPYCSRSMHRSDGVARLRAWSVHFGAIEVECAAKQAGYIC